MTTSDERPDDESPLVAAAFEVLGGEAVAAAALEGIVGLMAADLIDGAQALLDRARRERRMGIVAACMASSVVRAAEAVLERRS